MISCGIHREYLAVLFQVVEALRRLSRFPSLVQRGQQHRGKNGDYRYYDKQLNQCE